MEFLLRFLSFIFKFTYFVIYPGLCLVRSRRRDWAIPSIKNQILCQSIGDLTKQLQQYQIHSEEIVKAYIERIKEVNPLLNAVVQECYAEALQEAKSADVKIGKAQNEGKHAVQNLFAKYPLLGLPFTVKEACGLKGKSFLVGSKKRQGMISPFDGEVVQQLRSSGAIPLLVSANPEYCMSIECRTLTSGVTVNPYDSNRTSGGSSGGEGALNGAGASLFGVGSDIAGSIRIPGLFNGVFGHKPTGGITSVIGHFPNAADEDIDIYLQLGPLTRFASDLPLLMKIMAGNNVEKLKLTSSVQLRKLKIHYALGFHGLNGLLHTSVSRDIQKSISRAVTYFKNLGLQTQKAKVKLFHNSLEISLSALVRLQGFPYLMPHGTTKNQATIEFLRSIFTNSNYTKEGLNSEVFRRSSGMMPLENFAIYKREADELRQELTQLLGDNGVLFFPTFVSPAVHHNISLLPAWNVDYTMIFNIAGLPATHVPMGLNSDGLPIGFQVVAAPYQDKLCFEIAAELERGFGGWQPPSSHLF